MLKTVFFNWTNISTCETLRTHLDMTHHSTTLCSRCTPFLNSSCLSSKLTSSLAVTLASTRLWLDSRGAYFSSNTCLQSQRSGASKCGRCAMLLLAVVSPLTFTRVMQVTRTWRWVSDTKLWTNWLQSTKPKLPPVLWPLLCICPPDATPVTEWDIRLCNSDGNTQRTAWWSVTGQVERARRVAAPERSPDGYCLQGQVPNLPG